MEFIKILLIILITINVIIHLVWDGSLTFNKVGWVKNILGEKAWGEVQKYSDLNQCDRWISSINFCFMSIAGIIMIIGIIKDNSSSTTSPGEILTKTGSIFQVFSIIYVTAKLINISGNLLSSNINNRWKATLISSAFQIFILSIIVYLYSSKLIEGKGVNILNSLGTESQGILFFIIIIVLLIIIPYIIMRVIPSNNSGNNTDTNGYFNENFSKNNKLNINDIII